MIEIVGELVNMGFPPALALAGGLVWLYIRTSRALRESQEALVSCEKARKCCNDKVHELKDKISVLETAILTAEARVVALEVELEQRLGAVESKNAS